MTHICVSKLNIIGSDNGLWPGRHQAIIWTNARMLLIGPLGKHGSEMLIEIHTSSFKKMHVQMSSVKRRPLCPGLNVLNHWGQAPLLSNRISVIHGSRINYETICCPQFCTYSYQICVMWEGQALPHDTNFGNSRCEIVGRRVIFIWSLIHGLRWSGLIKAEPGDTYLQMWTGSSLVQVMAWWLTVPRHYLIQYWLIIRILRNIFQVHISSGQHNFATGESVQYIYVMGCTCQNWNIN